jgi:hypothetical protein
MFRTVHNNTTNSTVKLLHQNVQSLINKMINIEGLLTDKTLESDVLRITEHWLDEKKIGYYNLENYSLISTFCRKNKKHRGSYIYAKTNLVAKPCELGNEPSGSIKCWELASGCTNCGL